MNDTLQAATRKDDRDSWTEGDTVFVHHGWRWATARDGSPVCLGPVDAVQDAAVPSRRHQGGLSAGAGGTKVPLAPDVTLSNRQCAVCGVSLTGRADARSCGPRCRQQLRRRRLEVLVE